MIDRYLNPLNVLGKKSAENKSIITKMKSVTGTQVLYFKESITFESKYCISKKVFV